MQGEELNLYGKLYIHLNPKLKIKVVDGSSLAVAVVLNSIPKGTTQVLFRGNLTKVAYFIASALCQMDIQVCIINKHYYGYYIYKGKKKKLFLVNISGKIK